MRNNVSKFIALPVLGLSLVLGSSLFINSYNKKEVQKVEGYNTSTLPTTIDLNDTSASDIRSYYSALSSLATSQRQGTNLLKNLKTILKNGQKYYSYDSGSDIWKMYEITDRDWDKSPASAISGYNASTKIVTDYTYGTSTSDKGSNPYLHALYINRNITNEVRAWDDHQQTEWGINREHVWAKAEGFDSGGSGGARGDPMHLMAANGYANNIHSNYFYGYVDTSSSYTDCGTKYSNQSGNLRGTSKTLDSGTVFEPQDCDKGDIARAIFYMVARYNYYSGSDSDGIDGANPNLALSQSLSDWSSSGYTSSTSTKGYMGVMTDLLAWHHADPVDEYEIHRNNLLYTNFTNNRNPFIDFPEWVDYIWGTATYNGTTYSSYSSTPTGYATPSSDTINGYNSGTPSTISVTGVSLNKNSTTLTVGDTETLVATIAPNNATNQNVTWTSGNTSIATVSNSGVVTAVAQGSTTITVTTQDGGYSASCTVSVTNPVSQKTLSSISVSGQTTSFTIGDSFSFGGTVTAHFSDSTTSNVTSSASFSGYNMNSTGTQTVTVSYTYSGTTKTTEYQITVNEDASGSTFTQVTSLTSGHQYIIVGNDNGYALPTNPTVSSGKVAGTAIADVPSNGAGYLWTITQYDSYWLIGDGNQYIYHSTGGNSSTNLAYGTSQVSYPWQLTYVAETNDKPAHWTFAGVVATTSTFTVKSRGMLCNNGSFGGYALSNEGGTNYGYMNIYEVASSSAPTSISASVSKTYYVGDTISSSDITVTNNLNQTVSTFTFASDGYQFSYSDAASGGALTNKVFTNAISSGNLTCNLTVQVQRKAYVDPGTSDLTLTSSEVFNGIGGGNSNLQSGYLTSPFNMYYYKAYYYSNGGAFSFGNANEQEGYLINTDPIDAGITYIHAEVNSTSKAVNERLSVDGTNWVLFADADPTTYVYKYFKIDCAGISGSKYSNITSISLTTNNEMTPVNVANYVMFEDTNNQCTSKFDVAINKFNRMSTSGRSSFMTSEDVVLGAAHERLSAWATYLGKEIVYENGDYVVRNANKSISAISNTNDNKTVSIIVIVVALNSIALTTCLIIKKRKTTH